MNNNVKQWYMSNHASDELGGKIDDTLTFQGLWNGLKNGADVYELLGVGDSIIREFVFDELAKRKGVDYDVIYNMWLGIDN
jgi:hypothetical protein